MQGKEQVVNPTTQESKPLAEARVKGLANTLQSRLAEDRAAIVTFAADITKDAHDAMERSRGAFTVAARVKVFEDALRGITVEGQPHAFRVRADDGVLYDSVAFLTEYAQREVNSRAARPVHSSSPTMNLMAQEVLAAWVAVLEMIRWA